MRAVLRCDASPGIGAGHAMRCLVIGETLTRLGWDVAFASTAETVATVPGIRRSGLQVLSPDPRDHGRAAFDVAILDHYGLAEADRAAWADTARLLVVFSDFVGPHRLAGLLVDPTPCRVPDDYADMVPPECRLLLGPDYALVAAAWRAERAASLSRRAKAGKVEKILVSMGATDPKGATLRVL
ncbi:hypothetical protein WDZ92_34355, partial [Nostoc sp. NIES-2111]